eukprot:GHVS01103234.1.p1 GENE.GHVS01103234.1~~GHVS01103234.1.p1  ORF type:complete len:342 (-),score=48.66 GHVS01103234.1:275-1300(-)
MSKPTKVIPSLCRGYLLSSQITSYSSEDLILYALSLGLSHSDPLDAADMQFTYEFAQPTFAALPTFPVVLPSFDEVFEGLNNCPGMPSFNPMMLLHGEQKVELLGSDHAGDAAALLPVEATVVVKSRIRNVLDKVKGALVVVEVEGREKHDAVDGRLMFQLYMSMFIRGIGGFGNEGTEEEDIFDRRVKKPSRKPDVIVDRPTFPSQALLYRLNGDKNPLHADPAMSQLGGFDRPILHGLCSYGIAVHSIMRHLCANDPSSVRSASARFVAPVVPGESLSVRMWKEERGEKEEGVVVFDVLNVNSGKLCIDNGVVRIAPQGGGEEEHTRNCDRGSQTRADR